MAIIPFKELTPPTFQLLANLFIQSQISKPSSISPPGLSDSSILINNLDEGTHPFHLHGHKFWVLAQGDGDFTESVPLDTNPVFRDTVSVRMTHFRRS